MCLHGHSQDAKLCVMSKRGVAPCDTSLTYVRLTHSFTSFVLFLTLKLKINVYVCILCLRRVSGKEGADRRCLRGEEHRRKELLI